MTTQQTASACSNNSHSALTLKRGSDLTNASWRDSRGLQSTEGQSPSWLKCGEVFACAGKERGLLFLMEMCMVCTLQEGLCEMVSISYCSCFGNTGFVHTRCFPPRCVSHTLPVSWSMWTSSMCLTGQTSTVRILSKDFFHSCTPKRL